MDGATHQHHVPHSQNKYHELIVVSSGKKLGQVGCRTRCARADNGHLLSRVVCRVFVFDRMQDLTLELILS